jgi:hypothetical protein
VFSAVAALFAFYGAVMLVAVASGAALRAVVPAWWFEDELAQVALSGVILIAGGLVTSAVLVRAGWTSWQSLGWFGGRRDARALASGVATGLAAGAGALALAVAVGRVRLVTTGEPVSAYVVAVAALALALFASALGEEIVFRGYPLARLARSVGKVRASLALSVLFAAMHLFNPSVTPLGIVNIALASLVLSAAFFTPGGLPAAWGVHFGWNGALSLVDAPVSGLSFELPWLDFASRGAYWIDGGTFGPEGGIAATIALGITLLGERAARAGAEQAA